MRAPALSLVIVIDFAADDDVPEELETAPGNLVGARKYSVHAIATNSRSPNRSAQKIHVNGYLKQIPT